MSRICVYVIYDKGKKIYDYIEPALCEIRKYTDYLIVVCNFDDIVSGRDIVEKYADEIIFRNNVGFDAGAYKETLINYITWEKMEMFDELLLTNDTYFAPVFPFEEMFNTMTNEKCDFWGITRHPKGFLEGKSFDSHIQSYFLNFKKVVFNSEVFKTFWSEYKYGESKNETIIRFELGLNEILKKEGFVGKAYMECFDDLSFIAETCENPYQSYALELIKYGRMPIIKKTNFCFDNRKYVNTCKAMEYINRNTNYDISLIIRFVKEKNDLGDMGTYFDFCLMEKFILSHEKIYIYGCGKWGKILAEYFGFRGWKFESFLVSKFEDNDNVRVFEKGLVKRNDGIIIAQNNKKKCDEIIEYISTECRKEQMFTPCYVNQ